MSDIQAPAQTEDMTRGCCVCCAPERLEDFEFVLRDAATAADTLQLHKSQSRQDRQEENDK